MVGNEGWHADLFEPNRKSQSSARMYSRRAGNDNLLVELCPRVNLRKLPHGLQSGPAGNLQAGRISSTPCMHHRIYRALSLSRNMHVRIGTNVPFH